jgi:hypothetical protein
MFGINHCMLNEYRQDLIIHIVIITDFINSNNITYKNINKNQLLLFLNVILIPHLIQNLQI